MLLKKNTLYNSIVNFITKKGNKELAKSILDLALLKASKKSKLSCFSILARVFNKLKVSVEVRYVRRRGKIYKIPFPIKKKRQQYLGIKWFFQAIQEDNKVCHISDKLCSELLLVLKNSNKSKSLSLKKENVKLAIKFRSQIHFRW